MHVVAVHDSLLSDLQPGQPLHVNDQANREYRPLLPFWQAGRMLRAAFAPRAYLGSLIMTAAALGVGLALRHFLAVSNMPLGLVMAVRASAVTYGVCPAIATILISVPADNLFFL